MNILSLFRAFLRRPSHASAPSGRAPGLPLDLRPFCALALAGLVSAVLPAASAQVVLNAPQSQTVSAGANVSFNVIATGAATLSYQWQFNGTDLAATSSTLALTNVQPANAGLYTVAVTSGTASTLSTAILGLTTSSKRVGPGFEYPNIVHPGTGFTYDQILLQGPAASMTADAGQILRVSYIDLTDDIVQVEFSGPGTLTLVLDNASGPVAPVKYNQPDVAYMKGHASLVITGATENTHLSVFSVGTLTSPNAALFPTGISYDGLADIASIAILSANGKFGSIRTANTSYFASKGLTGIYAPGVQFTGPVYVGDIDAFGTATPVLLLGSASDVRITGGDLQQTNTQPVAVSGFAQLNYVAGTKSNGVALAAQTNLGQLTENGVNVTSQVAASGPTVVTITANHPATDETGTTAGEFTVTRTGPTLTPLTINYGVGGTATNAVDYPALVGFVTIPAGAASATVALQPYADTSVENSESVVLTLAAGGSYALGAANAATVSIADSASTLYVATLRPASGAGSSAASGLATIVLSASGTIATVNVSFSNLSSGQTGAHLFRGNSSSAGDYVRNLPLGQVTGAQWNILPTATYTSTQILDALRNGLIYVGLDTAQFPAGELRGAFLSAVGSQVFEAPTAPPAVALTNITATDAARLLTQATFGPRKSEIDALTGGSIDAWITAQMALPTTSHRTRTLAELEYVPITTGNSTTMPYPFHRQYAWFHNVLQGPDQLRQRVAFALSQIFVISDTVLGNQQQTEGVALYYDQLADGAFGNFRTLLEQVTLSPMMGIYLSHLRNAKADPVAGTNPDENYAREVMQLFTVGLVQLQPDGTLKLDAEGLPIPTYNQSTITETAKVLTGFSYSTTLAVNGFRRGPPNYVTPMMAFDDFHEPSQKTIIGGLVIPANLGAVQDLQRLHDALFNHANTPAFISRQLIQRLVTANPSPAYVYRVAEKFRNNGSGVRGDLGTVVRAILTDYEARSPAVTDDPGYGKLKEPLLRLTGVLRSLNAASTSGHYTSNFNNPDTQLAQAALRSPSVFNFFEPGYVFPGALAAAGLVAPEFQITNDTTAISVPNYLRSVIFQAATGTNAVNQTTLDLTTEQGLVSNIPALLDYLAFLLANGQLGTETRARITTALATLSATTTTLERAQSAVLLVATSPEGATQK